AIGKVQCSLCRKLKCAGGLAYRGPRPIKCAGRACSPAWSPDRISTWPQVIAALKKASDADCKALLDKARAVGASGKRAAERALVLGSVSVWGICLGA